VKIIQELQLMLKVYEKCDENIHESAIEKCRCRECPNILNFEIIENYLSSLECTQYFKKLHYSSDLMSVPFLAIMRNERR